MRVVADTNTLVSGLLWQGAPRRLVDAAQEGLVHFVTSQALIDELKRVLARPKFAARMKHVGVTADTLLATYSANAELVVPANIPPTVLTDPDDDTVLAAALGGQAMLIISGDRDLLDLKRFHDIPIVTVGAALALIARAIASRPSNRGASGTRPTERNGCYARLRPWLPLPHQAVRS